MLQEDMFFICCDVPHDKPLVQNESDLNSLRCTDLQGDEDSAGTDGKGDDGHERTHHQVRVENLFLQEREK